LDESLSSDSAAAALASAADGWLMLLHLLVLLRGIVFDFLFFSSAFCGHLPPFPSRRLELHPPLLPRMGCWMGSRLFFSFRRLLSGSSKVIMPFAKVPWSDAVIKFQFSTGFDVAGLQQRTVISPH
jgi:hypothetical protein